MKRMACMASAVAILFIGARADDATPSIKEIMGKLHKGDESPLAKLKKSLKSDEPDWKDVQDLTKDFESLGASLAKNDPPKGGKSAFEKRAKAYYQYAKSLNEAAKAKDKGKAQTALNKIGSSCKACHTAHKKQ